MKTEEEFGLISIIMAAYNAEMTIGKAISSVLSQTYRNFELLVVDDCSTDRTDRVIERFQKNDDRRVLIKNHVNCGVSVSRKRGMEEAKGQWIAVLDSDDAWVRNKLEKQIAIQKEKNADLIYSGSGFMDHEGKIIHWYLKVPEVISYKCLLKQNLISNSSVLIRKELYSKYYVENDDIHEDFAEWLNILKNRKKVYGINEPLLIYRVSRISRSGNKLKAVKMNWNTYRYVGLSIFSAIYYECWYIFKGLYKYWQLKKHGLSR